MARVTPARIKESLWYRFLRHTDWYGMPTTVGAEPPSRQREIQYWSERTFRQEEDHKWDQNAADPYFMRASRIIVETLGRLHLPVDCRLHEFGCALGRNAYYIVGAFPSARLSGNDVNPHAREIGRAHV